MIRLSSALLFLLLLAGANCQQPGTTLVVFEGTESVHKWSVGDLDPPLPSDWSSYEYLVLEFRHSSPQRFFLFAYDRGGPRRVVIQPFGQNVWIRAAVPLKYFQRRDYGSQMALVNNKPTNSFWMSVWGPFGTIDSVEAVGVTMQYPIGKPTLEIRSIKLAKEDPGSEVLEKLPVVDEFGQWVHADWPRKVKSLDQLKEEWSAEEGTLQPGNYGYCSFGGYENTEAKATGFFRLEKRDDRWWFVDPDGHLYLSIYVPGLGSPGYSTQTEHRREYYAAFPPEDIGIPAPRYPVAGPESFHAWNLFRRFGSEWRTKAIDLTIKRMDSWGLTTGPSPYFTSDLNIETGKPYLNFFRVPRDPSTSFLGLPDVYSEEFVRLVDEAAASQMGLRKDDPYMVGYFVGNEPPWPERESELVDLILNGPESATRRTLQAFLAEADTEARREEFIRTSFKRYLEVVSDACRRHDPNHLNLGMRFGGQPPDYLLEMASVFDVCSLNPYEYSPIEHLDRAYQLIGKPIIFGEFQFGVPGDGLGGSLVQAASQMERGVAYQYYLENAASHPAFVGAAWFIGVDEPVTGRLDGENYNIGFVDVTDRPYPDLVEAAKRTHERLFAVHSGQVVPVTRKPKASELGTPSYRLSDSF